MLKIKLADLMKQYDLTISELSDATGIARSTLTPLIKQPTDIDNVRLKTVNTICDFFGVSVQSVLDFIASPLSEKYHTAGAWYASNGLQCWIELARTIGNKERHVVLSISGDGFGTNGDALTLTLKISPLNVSDMDEVDFDVKNQMNGDLFFSDLMTRSDNEIVTVSKVITMASLFTGRILKNLDKQYNNLSTDINQVNVCWIKNSKTDSVEKYLHFTLDKNKNLTFDHFSNPDATAIHMLSVMENVDNSESDD